MAPSDPDAYPQAVELLDRLTAQSGNGVLFGHQDTSAYGVYWEADGDDAGKSDIKEAFGSYPAVYGWDLGGVELGKETNLDGVHFQFIAKCIREADKRGGINTVSFHQDNPISGGSAFDNTPAVAQIIPEAEHYVDYLSTLDAVADFLGDLQRDDGTLIPIIVRPYHEPNRSWPWWSLEQCEEEQYKALWHMTVSYMRERHEMHQLLWCFSPQDVSDRDAYMVGYPGDDVVDIFGLDYYDIYEEEHSARMGEALSMINQVAEEHGKIAALTETGVQNIPRDDWFTACLLPALQTDEHSMRTVWALLWRNQNEEHFFAPHKDHASVENFKEMLASGTVVLGRSEADGDQQVVDQQKDDEEKKEEENGPGCVIA